MEKYYNIIKINEFIYQISDPLGVLATLVIGEKKALLFDTTYGFGDLKKTISNLTDKPLIVINSHGHMDHTGGNYQFSEIFISKDDFLLFEKHNSPGYRTRNFERLEKHFNYNLGINKDDYIHKTFTNFIFVKEHDIFDLGGIVLEVIFIPGHTTGSIALFIKNHKIMLVGDGAVEFTWVFLDESTKISEYINSLKKILLYDFELFLTGHGAGFRSKEKMKRFLKIAEEIDLDHSVKVSYEGFDDIETYCYTDGTVYGRDSVGIMFSKNKL